MMRYYFSEHWILVPQNPKRSSRSENSKQNGGEKTYVKDKERHSC